MDTIRNLDGIAFASPILVAQLPNRQQGRVDLAYGIDMSRVRDIKPHWQIAGSIPDDEDEIILGAEIAEHQGLKTGDTLAYPDINVTFRVAGILKKTGSQDDAFMYIPVKTAQAVFKKPSGATAIGVKVIDPALLTRTTDELSEKSAGHSDRDHEPGDAQHFKPCGIRQGAEPFDCHYCDYRKRCRRDERNAYGGI